MQPLSFIKYTWQVFRAKGSARVAPDCLLGKKIASGVAGRCI